MDINNAVSLDERFFLISVLHERAESWKVMVKAGEAKYSTEYLETLKRNIRMADSVIAALA